MELYDSGGDGPPVLFLHGAFVDRSLWDPVVALLRDRRCVVPTLPLGSHTVPVADRSLLTPLGVVERSRDSSRDLALHDVTVVASDTGGALAQLLVTRRPEGIGRLVLAPCDALEVFPPVMFKPLFKAGRSPYALAAFIAPLRFPPALRLPIAFGWLTKRASRRDAGGVGATGAERLRDRPRRRALPGPHGPLAAARRRPPAARVLGRGGARLAAGGSLLQDRAGPPARGPVP